MRAEYFDPQGKPSDNAFNNMQPADFLEVRQPPAGSFSTVVNRENEHLATQSRR